MLKGPNVEPSRLILRTPMQCSDSESNLGLPQDGLSGQVGWGGSPPNAAFVKFVNRKSTIVVQVR